jgi:hypothetical protein
MMEAEGDGDGRVVSGFQAKQLLRAIGPQPKSARDFKLRGIPSQTVAVVIVVVVVVVVALLMPMVGLNT